MAVFAERFKELRDEKGWSRDECAERLGIGGSTVSMYETGKRIPPLKKLEMIADYFNVDLDYLLGKTDVKRKIDLAGSFSLDLNSTEVDVIRIAKQLSPERRKMLMDMIRMMYADEHGE